MQRIIVQVPMTKDLKEKAEIVSADLGFSSLQETIRVLLTKLSKREFSLKVAENVEEVTYLSPQAERKFKKALEDIKVGKVSPSFDNVDDAIDWLSDPDAKYQVVIPKQARKKINIKPGQKVDVNVEGKKIVLVPLTARKQWEWPGDYIKNLKDPWQGEDREKYLEEERNSWE